jgi:hypothetical protein
MPFCVGGIKESKGDVMQDNQIEFLSNEMINFLSEGIGNVAYGLCSRCPLSKSCENHAQLSCMEMWHNYLHGMKIVLQKVSRIDL